MGEALSRATQLVGTATGSGDLIDLRDSAQKVALEGGCSCRYLMDDLPPVACVARLRLELQLVSAGQRGEALQVAWVAHLEGKDAARAVNTWWRRELRQRRREITIGTDCRASIDSRFHDPGRDQAGSAHASEGVERDRLGRGSADR